MHAAGRNSEPRPGQADPAGAWKPTSEQELGGAHWAVGGGRGGDGGGGGGPDRVLLSRGPCGLQGVSLAIILPRGRTGTLEGVFLEGEVNPVLRKQTPPPTLAMC